MLYIVGFRFKFLGYTRAADSVALGCAALAPHFTYFQTLRSSEDIFCILWCGVAHQLMVLLGSR